MPESTIFRNFKHQFEENGGIRLMELISYDFPVLNFSHSNFKLVQDSEDEVCLEIKSLDSWDSEISSVMSSLPTFKAVAEDLRMTFSAGEVRDLPHNFVLEFLELLNSNVKMGDLEPQDVIYDKLTPDYMEKQEHQLLVLELKTHRRSFWLPGSENLLGEQWKYWQALSKKAVGNRTILLGSLIFFGDRVYYPHDWPIEKIKQAAICLQVAWTMQSFIYGNSSVKTFTETEVSMMSFYHSLFESVPYPKREDPLHLDEEFCKKVTSPEAHVKARIRFLKTLKKESNLIKKLDAKNILQCREIKELFEKGGSYTSPHEVEYRQKVSEKLSSLGENPSKFKSVVQHPLVSVKDTGWDLSSIVGDYKLEEIGVEGKIWSSFLLNNLGRSFTQKVDWYEVGRDIEHVFEERSQRHIQSINLSKSKVLELALKGVRGKSHSTRFEKIEAERNSQKGFPLDAHTADIEAFIRNGLIAGSAWLDVSEVADKMLDLVHMDIKEQEELFQINGGDNELDKFVSEFRRTKLFRALRVLEQIVSEVNYSRQTNLKDNNTFIFKKIPNVDGFLAIVPSRADRHIFYSVLFPKSSVEHAAEKPFKPLIDGGDFWFSEFVSLDQVRISHLLGCSSKLLAVFIQKLQTNFPTSLTQLEISKSWSEECAFSMLTFLEDKAQTSTALLQIRYAYMDLFSTKELVTHPLKILNKMPTIIRSRLLVWTLNRCLSTFNELFKLKILGKLGLRKALMDSDDKLAKDDLAGFLSWITAEPVWKISHMLDLSYLGHLHNKEEGDIIHGYLQIFSKIAKEEYALRNCRKEYLLGEDDPMDHEDVRSHEFSVSAVIMIGRLLKLKISEEISRRYPRECEGVDNITWYLFSRFDHLKMEDLSTTKASAWDLDPDQKYVEGESDETNRRKVMSALHSLYAEGKLTDVNVVQAALQALEIQQRRSNKGVLVNLFKKQQLGGPREIFVLTFIDRLLIFILETISRALCELMENEMLTKGDAKIIRSDEHMRRVHDLAGSKGAYKLTATTSGDATTWCQRFTMRMFGTFLLNLLPEIFHPIVCHILNGITNKRLQLPHKLLQLWKKFPDIEGFDPYMNILKSQFLNPHGDHDLIDYNSRMLKNRSNFMQGILHYTSSLFHSGFLHMMSTLIKQDVERNHLNCVITTKCSSDDSSVIITLVSEEKSILERVGQGYLRRCLLFLNHFYWVFGAKASVEKSTISVLGLLEEFNSVWLVQNTVVMPLIKFVSSCFRTPPFTTFDEAQRQFASARNQVLSNGGSFALLKVIQEEQCFHYYKSLGLFNVQGGEDVFHEIRQTKTPFLGYFILEPCIMVGLLGFEMAYYMLLRLDDRAASSHIKFYKNKFSDLNEALEFRSRITLGPGGLRKYTDFFHQLKTSREEIKEFFLTNPEKLFVDWKTVEDLKKGIELKASRYQTAQVFSGVMDAITFNRSVYVLTSKVFTERLWYDPGKAHKHTWLHLIHKFNTMREYNITFCEWRKDFILADFYDEILNAAIEESNQSFVECQERRKILCSRSLRSFEGPNLVPLSTCAAAKWFGARPLFVKTQHELELSWKVYKNEISWLTDDFAQSVERSGLDSVVELKSLLNAYEKKSKTMTVLCPMTLNVSTEMFVRKAIRNNQWPKNKLKKSTHQKQFKSPFKFADELNPQEAISTVINVCTLPDGEVLEKSTKRELPLRQALLHNLASCDRMKAIYAKLNYLNRDSAECLRCLKFYDKIQNEGNLFKRQDALRECLRETGSIFTHYLIRQKRDPKTGRWSGKLLFNLIIDGEVFNVCSENDLLKYVKTKQVESALRVSHKLCKVLLDHGIKSCALTQATRVNIHLLTGKLVRVRSNLTLPLIEQKNLDIHIRLPRDPLVKFEISEFTLKLIECKSETTICMARFSSMGGLRVPNEDLLKEAFNTVLLNDNLKKLLINYCLNLEPEPGWNQSMFKALMSGHTPFINSVKVWLKHVMTTRLEKKGFRKTRDVDMVLDTLEERQTDIVHEVNPELLCLPDMDMNDDEILEFLKQDLEENPIDQDQSFFTEDNPHETSFDLLNFEEDDDYLITETCFFDTRYYKLITEPRVMEEKSWMDSAFSCITNLPKSKVIRLFRGEVRKQELTSDMLLLCEFLDIPVKAPLRREDLEIILT